MAGAEGRRSEAEGLSSPGLWGGRRVSAFHRIALRSGISPKTRPAVVVEQERVTVGSVGSRLWSVAWVGGKRVVPPALLQVLLGAGDA